MKFGECMDSEDLRRSIAKIAEVKGQLSRFCEEHDLPYLTIWRFSQNATGKLEFDLGLKLAAIFSQQTGEVENA